MTRNSAAGVALVAGSVAGLVTMSLHPTGADVHANASSGGHNLLAIGVHALAIAALPVMLAATLVLTLRLARSNEVAWVAFIVYAMATVAVLIAAVASGLVVPALVENYGSADTTLQAVIRLQTMFAFTVNQAFAKVFVMFSALAIMLWCAAMLCSAEFSRGLAGLGLAIGVSLMVGTASGHLQLDIHGFGAVVLAQAAWMCWTGVVLRRLEPQRGTPPLP